MSDEGIRLNLGCGRAELPGYVNIDRRLGTEVYPLTQYADSSVDEIRASHILEHASYADAQKWMIEWCRVLKPNGVIKVAVPCVRKAVALADRDTAAFFYIAGGQTDQNDFHRSVWDETRLDLLLESCGIREIAPWAGDSGDSSTHEVSVGRIGVKSLSAGTKPTVKCVAIMSLPRVGWNDSWGCVFEALFPFKIPIHRFGGVFWGQCMQRMLEDVLAKDLDWVVCIDYDSMFTVKHMNAMFNLLLQRPDIDALAAMQPKRGSGLPLFSVEGSPQTMEVTGQPIKVESAHFGLTVLRIDALKKVAKPYFLSHPDENNGWGINRVDEDIHFWNQWKKAGNSVYVAPDVRIGHLEVMVSEYDADFQLKHTRVEDWRNANGHKSERWQ